MRQLHFRALDLTAKYRVKRVQLHKAIFRKPMWAKHPTVIQFDTQNICNAKCIYCNPHGTFIKKQAKLPLKTINNVLQYVKNKGWFINYVPAFMNGDPLLELRLPTITQMIKSYLRAKVIIFTNGIAYNNRHLLLDKNLDLINFTVSAATAKSYKKVHGVDKFSDALKTISWFKKHRKLHQRIRLVYILCKENFHELEAWKNLFSCFDQNVRPPFDAGEYKPQSRIAEGDKSFETYLRQASQENYPASLEYKMDIPCACWDSLNISFEGNIMQCMDLPYQFNWGNVNDVDISEVWHKRNQLGLDHEACRQCKMKNPRWKEIFEKYVWN